MSANSVITSIAYNVSTARPQVMNGLTISMKHTTATTLSTFDNAGLIQVYTGNNAMSSTGWQTLVFQNDFVWNGVDNLLIQVCFDNTSSSSDVLVSYRGTGSNRAVFQRNNTNAVSGCNMTTATTSLNIPITRFTVAPGLTPTLLNYSASASLSTNFAHRRGASSTPKFTLSSNTAFNTVQIELNTASNFSGTAYITTINDGSTYTASTPYDFWTIQALPAGDRTYFVRARLSDNAGSTWGPWTTQLWPYSFYASTPYPEEGWYYTAQEQFQTGTIQETNYNFISIQDNSSNYPDDDYFQLNQGSFNLSVSTNEDQYLTEASSHHSGASNNFLTIGSYYSGGSARQDYNGFRFTGFPVPNGAAILTSNLKVYSSDVSDNPIRNSTNPLYLELVGVDQTNANAWANSTSTETGGPRWRVRKAITIPWNITASWTDLALITSPDISPIIEDIVGTPGYNAGNAIAVIVDYTGTVNTSANRHRYLSTGGRNVAYRPRIDGTFTNYYNTVRFPDVDRAMYDADATAWNELKISDDLTNCTGCRIEYRIHNKIGGAELAGPFIRTAGQSGMASFPISGVSASEIYVSARVFRTNNTPEVQALWLTATEPSPLPVTMSTMHVLCNSNEVQVDWSTASEDNTDYFVVEKSTDMINWHFVKNITAAGFSSTLNHYSILDKRPVTDINYYRISSVDFNGFTQTYQPLSVKCDFTGDLQITTYPNPFTNEFTISTYSNVILPDVSMEICDITGRVVHSQIRTIPAGNSSFLLNSNLKSAGIYFLRIKSSDNYLHSIKLVKE